ncbi:MAG: ribosome assembly factor SBDS [Candidatus Woesearchaeota archaeon]|nr:ribosome assembly factor SBDS [Candidatus Woesearchaeota archaeon]
MERKIIEKERVAWNLAKLKKGGELFEVVVDPDAAVAFKRGTGDIQDCLKAEKIFFDAQRGLHAGEEHMQTVFGTTNVQEIATKIIKEGELQLSAEHRARMRDAKYKQIVSKIQAYAVDPKTGIPHPATRIELAMQEAKIRVDEKQDVESQITTIVKQLQPIIPIKLETVTLQVHLPQQYGQKLFGSLERHGTVKKTEWLEDGGLLAWVELPAGLQAEMAEDLGKKTHGAAEIQKVDEHPL